MKNIKKLHIIFLIIFLYYAVLGQTSFFYGFSTSYAAIISPNYIKNNNTGIIDTLYFDIKSDICFLNVWMFIWMLVLVFLLML